MRNLTVIRRKAFAGCLGKVKIYIEDVNGDTEINGIKCKLLGAIKNNSSAVFEISNEPLRLFAIYDKVSKGYCYDCYPIPAGEGDYFVSGRAQLNPAAGNPFYFDGVSDPQTLANRANGRSKGMVVFIVAIAVGAIVGVVISMLLF